MDREVKECVRKVNKGRDMGKVVPEYVELGMKYNNEYARINLAMDYFTYYEQALDDEDSYADEAREIIEEMNRVIEELYENNPDDDGRQKLCERLLKLRETCRDRMYVLSAYVDRSQLHYYIIHRTRYLFEDEKEMPDDAEFKDYVIRCLLNSRDDADLNVGVRLVVEELPMRMTRKRYFDLIRESVSLYRGEAADSLDRFEYNFRTNSTLYRDENMDRYHVEFKEAFDELDAADYENMTEEEFDACYSMLEENDLKIRDLIDLYDEIAEIVNSAYMTALSGGYSDMADSDGVRAADLITRGINSIFLKRDSDVWEMLGCDAAASDEDKYDCLYAMLEDVEGRQEELWDSLDMLEAAFYDLIESQKEVIAAAGFDQDFECLRRMFMLTSSSVFAELDESECDEVVTDEMVSSLSERLIGEIKELFKGKSRMFRRAVMAATLKNMPVFFRDMQQVEDYVSMSLAQCDNYVEKYTAKRLIMNDLAND